MITINANTKIAEILKQHPAALDAIVGISKKFEKLRNPLLRKLMAPRTSLSAASKFGGCSLEDFFKKLEPLGFVVDRNIKEKEIKKTPVPAFITSLKKEQLSELDVRPVITSGRDPLNLIMEKLKQVQPGQVLKVVNSFEPTPLILLLQKKGLETYVDTISNDQVDTYFFKPLKSNAEEALPAQTVTNDWEMLVEKFRDHKVELDVRHLEMPQPMLSILDALDHLPEATALYVFHKRIPVFLLPELSEREFEYRIREIADGEVHLFIFKAG